MEELSADFAQAILDGKVREFWLSHEADLSRTDPEFPISEKALLEYARAHRCQGDAVLVLDRHESTERLDDVHVIKRCWCGWAAFYVERGHTEDIKWCLHFDNACEEIARRLYRDALLMIM